MIASRAQDGAQQTRPAAKPAIRVLLIAPSLNILGGQAVQAQRLLSELAQDSSVSIDFLPIAPVFPHPFRFLQSIRYLRTILNVSVLPAVCFLECAAVRDPAYLLGFILVVCVVVNAADAVRQAAWQKGHPQLPER